MKPLTILKFLFGQRSAISEVASSSSAIWTGIVLVLITSIPRNYDQTFILDNPIRWLLGSLIFSLISGTWLYTITHGVFARRGMANAEGDKPPMWGAWRGFMGVFWMTAPIAWVYALPVEKLFDSLLAAKVNLALLGIVSVWRVLLMSRALQVIYDVPFLRTSLWVLLAAFVEVLVVTVFGGAFSRAILASMGGLRNSPEEDLVLGALGTAMTVSFWGIPVSVVILAIWQWQGQAMEWPVTMRSSLPWKPLSLAGAAWIALAVPEQIKLHRNFLVEQHIKADDMRGAIDVMNRFRREDFAVARPLPPKLYEWSTMTEVPKFVGALRAEDTPWVRQHGLHATGTFYDHLTQWRWRKSEDEITADVVQQGLLRWVRSPGDLANMLQGITAFEEGREWLKNKPKFLDALSAYSDLTLLDNSADDATKRAAAMIQEELRRIGYNHASNNLPSASKP